MSADPVQLAELNGSDVDVARTQVGAWCTSTSWIGHMVAARPWSDITAVHASADTAFDTLQADDWLEAFAGHPRIGDTDDLARRFAASGEHSATEQAGLATATTSVINELAARNDEYFDRFGHVFLICATGKTASAMLDALNARIGNDATAELDIAAAEQRKITHLRIDATLTDSLGGSS